MQSRLAKKRNCNSLRQGLSIVEFVGCFVAMGGGVFLGSMYLGIDLLETATDLLEKTQLVEAKQADNAELEQTPEDGENPVPTSTDENEVAQPDEEQSLVAADAHASPDKDLASADAGELTDLDRENVTRAYWKILADCVRTELKGRRSSHKNVANWQVFNHLEHRQIGHQQAADEIKELDESGVDEKLVSHAAQLLAWHLDGVQLYQRALDLITDGPSADLTSPFAQSWQSSVTQHRMEERLVQEKHLGMAIYLNRTYKSVGPFKPGTAP